ncbi:hypothetical protein ACE6H2_007768 [Prunus campanulata]
MARDSLFKFNPKGCLMILSKSMDSGSGYRILKPLLDRGFKLGERDGQSSKYSTTRAVRRHFDAFKPLHSNYLFRQGASFGQAS